MDNQADEHQAPEGRKKSEALWMMSFSDMCLVLLCFFVLLISIMKPDQQQLDKVTEKMKAAEVQEKVRKKEKIKKTVEATLKKKKLEKAATITEDAKGLVIEFSSGLLFSSGSARSNPKFVGSVNQVLKTLAEMPQDTKMVIEGHTDDTKLSGKGFIKSNWELSAARGFTMMRMLHKTGVAKDRVSVVAYASTRPKVPIQGLKGKALRKARQQNRRVVLRIYE